MPVYSTAQPLPIVTITDPALRLANDTERDLEDQEARPTFGYVYA